MIFSHLIKMSLVGRGYSHFLVSAYLNKYKPTSAIIRYLLVLFDIGILFRFELSVFLV